MSASILEYPEAIKKRLIWDILPCTTVEEFLESMDLFPGSPEVEELEHRSSHARLNRVGPIHPVAKKMALVSGEIVGRCILESQGLDYDEDVVNNYSKVAQASTLAVLANLLDLGLIHLGGQH